MLSMATYVRIFELSPDDEYVQKRENAVSQLSLWLSKNKNNYEIAGIAHSLSDSINSNKLNDELISVAEKIIRQESSSFIPDGQELQMIVCLLAAALDLIANSEEDENIDFYALCFFTSLSFQESVNNPALEKLRYDLLLESQKRIEIAAIEKRVRKNVPDIGKLSIPENTPTGSRANTAFKNATKPLIDSLKYNAELDREELDFLWWVLSGKSELLDIQYSALTSPCRAVIAGLDGSKKIRQIPSQGHRNILMRSVDDKDKISLNDLVASTNDFNNKISGFFNKIPDKIYKTIPVINALVKRETDNADCTHTLSSFEWGSRILLECYVLGKIEGRE